MPIDVVDVLGGNIELISDNRGVPTAVVHKPDPNKRLYTSHFATCPNAAQHRTKKAGR
jgi:hypothetical protein